MQKPKPIVMIIPVIVGMGILGALLWWRLHKATPADEITLYGNVDIRQVSLAFNSNERIAEMRVDEGDRVKQGQVLAVLVTTTLKLKIAQAQAKRDVEEQALRRLRAGNRPQEIAQARADVADAQADATRASRQYQRLQAISSSTGGRAVSQQDQDAALAAQTGTRARLIKATKILELAELGPRQEDIAQARAQLDAAGADLNILTQQLADAQLQAPTDAIVRSRLVEPGDMASAQQPVYGLAIVDPVWVRAYIPETELGRVRPGQAAQVVNDSYPDRRLDGCVGYLSSVAEFTPKTVQTADLRTSLVYEIRIRVADPDNRLRQGMPATVSLSTNAAACSLFHTSTKPHG